MNVIFQDFHQLRIKHVLFSFFVLLLLLLIGFFIWRNEQANLEKRASIRFESETNEISDLLKARIDLYRNALQGGKALFVTDDNVTRQEWKTYVDEINIQKNYPGIQGIGYTIFIKPNELQKHITSIRAQGFAEYTLRPPGDRDIYSSIIYLEPFKDRNLRAFGYDMYSEPVRRAAMQRAIETGTTSLSGKVTLVQETNKDVQPGFLMYEPLYKKGLPHDTVEDRKKNIIGFVYSPFRMKDFVSGILGNKHYDIDFEVFDSANVNSENEMFDSDKGHYSNDISYTPRFKSTKKIELYGNTWSIMYISLPDYMHDSNETIVSNIILIGGISISFLIAAIVFILLSSQAASMQLAKKMNQKAEHSRSELSALVDNMPIGVLYEDENRLMRKTNKEFTKLFGIPADPESMIGSDCAQAAVGSSKLFAEPDKFIKRIEVLLREKKIVTKEELKLADGRVFHRDYVPIFVEGKYSGILWIYSDITKEKEIDKAKTEFVSLASHQLRTPLTSIKWYSEMLADPVHGKLTTKQSEFVSEITKGNERMIALVNALLDVSRIDLGKITLNPEKFDIVKTTKNIIHELDSQIIAKKINLHQHYEQDNMTVNLDTKLTAVVLQNIIGNAVKYTPERGTVHVSMKTDKQYLTIAVKDTGYGIPEKDKNKIFNKLYRGENAQTLSIEGTGLGLYIAKSIVEQSGGKLTFESKENEGTIFLIQYPIDKVC